MNVRISLSVLVFNGDQEPWKTNESGRAAFDVTLPVGTETAINLSMLTPGLVAQAQADLDAKTAESKDK